MKTSILTIMATGLITLTFTSCNESAAQKVKTENVLMAETRDATIADFPEMTFENASHDFGTINEGEVVEHTFRFTNTGKTPLIIVSAKGSCGCTVPKWPKEAIAPGETGEFLVVFNSNGKPNLQNKKVTITANTKAGKETLKIKAMVTPKTKTTSAPISK